MGYSEGEHVNEWIWKTWDGISGMGSGMMTLCMKERLKGWVSDYACARIGCGLVE